MNGDQTLDQNDWQFMVQDILGTTFGDTNLDGVFDSSDLILAFQAGQYEDGTPTNSTWLSGVWNGDGEFDSTDLVFVFQAGGYESNRLQ